MILRRIWEEKEAAAALEFAFAAPVIILITVGTLELGIIKFMSSTIENAVLDASRSGATGFTTQSVSREQLIRDSIEDWSMGLLDMDSVDIITKIYPSFQDIGKPEPFTDLNSNGVWDDGEPFSDINGNGQWDPDMGQAGLGGPGEVVLYSVEYKWGMLTKVMERVMGDITFSSSIAVRNEPF